MAAEGTSRSRSVFPIVLIAVGALLLFGNLQLFAFGWILDILTTFWPLIITAMGISSIVSGTRTDFAGGLQLIVTGILLQIIVFGWLPGNLLSYWPFALIVVGLWLIFIQPKNKRIIRRSDASVLSIREFLHDAQYTSESDMFEGGKLSATLSRVCCDLSQCREGLQFMTLRADVRFSAVTLHIPESWRVTFDMRSSGGRPEDRRVLGNPPEGSHAPELVIQGSVLFSRFELRDERCEESRDEKRAERSGEEKKRAD